MSEYIKKSDVRHLLLHNDREAALAQLDELDAVDAVPVVHGYWIHGKEIAKEYCGRALVSILYENWWCSRCGRKLDTMYTPLYNYCPNCGAKMKGENDAID